MESRSCQDCYRDKYDVMRVIITNRLSIVSSICPRGAPIYQISGVLYFFLIFFDVSHEREEKRTLSFLGRQVLNALAKFSPARLTESA